MQTNQSDNFNGVTLTELMVTITILGLIMLGVQTFLSSGLKFFRLNQAKMGIQQNARTCLSLINRKLREASRGSIVISRLNSAQPPCSSIQFSTVDTEQFKFYQDGTKLYMENLTDSTKNLLAGDLRHITFCYPMIPNAEDIISISVCFEKWTRTPEARTLQLSVQKIRIMNN